MSLVLDPDDEDEQTLLFVYPRTSGYGLTYGENYGGADESGYIKQRIKLEFGARGDTEPFELRPISPYLAEDFREELPDAVTEVPALAVARDLLGKGHDPSCDPSQRQAARGHVAIIMTC
ncbi:nucleotidyl transferase AbiEii/AbiGii toxin family protein [Sphingobium indicum]|uniref:nucleotidyl transferase AbiEii/AbiGii toxin family protein n=1 Tax=Sphingobium indicum TaxID=332055 RepID=UPI0035ED38BB